MTEEVHIPEAKKKSFRVRMMESTWVRLGMATVAVGLLAGAVGGAGYFYRAYQKTLAEKDSLLSQMAGKAEVPEVESVVASVAELIDLPTGETPTLATVSDKSKLESQAFFKRAENGDKVLIYTNAGRAILYRPSVGKVIDMTAVNTALPETSKETKSTSSETGAVAGEKTESETAVQDVNASVSETEKKAEEDNGKNSERLFSVAVVNGTETSGLAKKTGEKVKQEFPKATLLKMADAAKKEYTKTTVVDVSGKFAEESKRLAELLKGEIGTLPEGETAPEGTEIFVVVGAESANSDL